MRPSIQKLSRVPETALLNCPSCYRMISYNPEHVTITCTWCGIAMKQAARHAR